MADLFLKIVNMSISASWLVLAVVVLRFVFKQAPKRFRTVLWGIVGIRLILPFSIESVFSLIPSAETVSPEIMYSRTPAIHSGIPALNSAVNPVISESFTPSPIASANPLQIWIPLAAALWAAGAAVMLACSLVSYLRLRRRVRTAVLFRDHIYQSEHAATPFILGIFRPRIYLPFRLSEKDMPHVIAHEQAHIKRRDHWIKPLGYLLLCVYWFNPLLWLAYILLCRDIELACDERVIKDLGMDQRADYSEALLSCSVRHRMIAACPLAFGEVGVKGRVKNVLNYKKPAFWIIIAAIAACVVLAVCFLTDPKTEPADDIQWDTRPTIIMDGAAYIDPYRPVSELPYGYEYAGTLSGEQANDTGLAGCEYYTNPSDRDSFYVFQECGTPININTVDSTQRQWAYVRWIREESDAVQERTLTLDIVRLLSQRHYGLTWTDFDRYSYTETGSGLYIRVYEIDEMFSLWIGGGSLEADPMYIYLRANDGSDEWIDIRDGGVEEFIARHKNNPLAAKRIYEWLNYYETPEEMPWEAFLETEVPEYPGVTFRWTPGQVEATNENGAALLFGGTPVWNVYFTDLTGDGLPELCATVSDGSGIIDTHVVVIDYSNGETYTLWDRGVYDYALTLKNGRLLVTKSEYPRGTTLAIGELILTQDEAGAYDTLQMEFDLSSEALIRSYTFQESKDTIKPCVALYDNGAFSFAFSVISSYLGYGAYEIDNDRLTLHTSDGKFTYVFDMVDDTLVFDADASSKLTWFSGLYDGAVLQ